MSQPGLGAMLHRLGGGSAHGSEEYYGRTVTRIGLENDVLTIVFTDGTTIRITDNGQSCCEIRYLRCDDDLASLNGQVLTKLDIKSREEKGCDYGELHEMCFLEIASDTDHITFVAHNEHNGYYGGFGMHISELSPEATH